MRHVGLEPTITLRQVWEQFKTETTIKTTTATQYDQFIRRAFKDWLDRPVTAITREKVAQHYRKIGRDSGPGYANASFRILRSLLSFARHRFHKAVIAGERARKQDDEQSDATKALREMISDGVLRAVTVEQIDGRLKAVHYEKQGPIAFIESTSAATIFAEDLNRCLVFYVDESQEQTARIVRAAAMAAAGGKRNVERLTLIHHAMQRMLRPMRVRIPYGQPHAKAVQKLRAALFEAVQPDDLRQIVETMVEKAKSGDIPAAKEILERTLGKPEAADFTERLESLEERITELQKRGQTLD